MSELNRKGRTESISGSAAEGFAKWKSSVSKLFPPLRLLSAGETSFSGSIRAGGADKLHMSRISSSAHVVERRPDLIARSSQGYLKLSLHLAGQSMLVQGGAGNYPEARRYHSLRHFAPVYLGPGAGLLHADRHVPAGSGTGIGPRRPVAGRH